MLTKFWEKWIAQEWKWMKVGTEKLKVDFMGSIDLRCWLWSRSNIQKWRTSQKWWKIIKITRKKMGNETSQETGFMHISQNAVWLSPSPSQNFRGTFAKMPLSADPSHQQGAHQRNRKHQGPWCLALAKPHFWKLGRCIGACFLRLQKARQYQRQVQGCASRPWYLAVAKPHLRKLGCYLWRER